jgi:hypothetical protein
MISHLLRVRKKKISFAELLEMYSAMRIIVCRGFDQYRLTSVSGIFVSIMVEDVWIIQTGDPTVSGTAVTEKAHM